ncbi:MmpS family transport accessory protein [Streptomyces sp. NPDC060194]|uniref:MmpS family transport accessory protein n=1 Tax=Streptomyces sp. NPDC060194 TaxID=3347069 RepID=UPI00365DB2BA
MTSGTEERVESPDEVSEPVAEGPALTGRLALVAAVVVLALCAGFALYGVLRDEDKNAPDRKVPTAAVTYEVTGEGQVDITYQGASEQGKAETVTRADLPWRKEVEVPLGRAPVVSVVIGAKGGHAKCALAVKGRHVQGATADGAYGRAGCTGVLPAPEPEPEPSAG